MNRTIKFRARYDGAEGGFVYTDKLVPWVGKVEPACGLSFVGGNWGISHSGNDNDWSVEKVSQFTGLLDKNGKEIYESDILCVVEDVCVEEIGGYPRYEPEGKFVVVEIPKIYYLFEEYEQEDIEIIGNIYENPELLNPPTP